LRVENVRGLWFRRKNGLRGEREEMLESEGKRVFENWECSLKEVLCGMRKVVIVNSFHMGATKPMEVKVTQWNCD